MAQKARFLTWKEMHFVTIYARLVDGEACAIVHPAGHARCDLHGFGSVDCAQLDQMLAHKDSNEHDCTVLLAARIRRQHRPPWCRVHRQLPCVGRQGSGRVPTLLLADDDAPG
jgi:hypothetical protein